MPPCVHCAPLRVAARPRGCDRLVAWTFVVTRVQAVRERPLATTSHRPLGAGRVQTARARVWLSSPAPCPADKTGPATRAPHVHRKTSGCSAGPALGGLRRSQGRWIALCLAAVLQVRTTLSETSHPHQRLTFSPEQAVCQLRCNPFQQYPKQYVTGL